MTPQVLMDSQDRVSYRYRVVARLSQSPLNPPWLRGTLIRGSFLTYAEISLRLSQMSSRAWR